MLRTPKCQNDCRAREVTPISVEIKETCRVNIPESKPHFSPRTKEKEKGVLWGYCGVQEFKWDTCARCRILAEEPIITTRRPIQWHTTRGDPAVEKKLQRGG